MAAHNSPDGETPFIKNDDTPDEYKIGSLAHVAGYGILRKISTFRPRSADDTYSFEFDRIFTRRDPRHPETVKATRKELAKPAEADALEDVIKALETPPADTAVPSIHAIREIQSSKDIRRIATVTPALYLFSRNPDQYPASRSVQGAYPGLEDIIAAEFAAYAINVRRQLKRTPDITDPLLKKARRLVRGMLAGEITDVTLADFMKSDEEIRAAEKQKALAQREKQQRESAEAAEAAKKLREATPTFDLYRNQVLLLWKDTAVRACTYLRSHKNYKVIRPLFPVPGAGKTKLQEYKVTKHGLTKMDDRPVFAQVVEALNRPPQEMRPPSFQDVQDVLSSRDLAAAAYLLNNLHYWRLRSHFEPSLENIHPLYETILNHVAERMAAHVVAKKASRQKPDKSAAIFERTKNRLELALDGKFKRINLDTFFSEAEPILARPRPAPRSPSSPRIIDPSPYQKGAIILFRPAPGEAYKAGIYEERDQVASTPQALIYAVRPLFVEKGNPDVVLVPLGQLRGPDSTNAVKQWMAALSPSDARDTAKTDHFGKALQNDLPALEEVRNALNGDILEIAGVIPPLQKLASRRESATFPFGYPRELDEVRETALAIVAEAVAARVVSDITPKSAEKRKAFDVYEYSKRIRYVIARISEGKIKYLGQQAFADLNDSRIRYIERTTGVNYFPKREEPAIAVAANVSPVQSLPSPAPPPAPAPQRRSPNGAAVAIAPDIAPQAKLSDQIAVVPDYMAAAEALFSGKKSGPVATNGDSKTHPTEPPATPADAGTNGFGASARRAGRTIPGQRKSPQFTMVTKREAMASISGVLLMSSRNGVDAPASPTRLSLRPRAAAPAPDGETR